MNKNDQAQFMITPWLYDSLNNQQYEQLYYLTPEMKTECEHELNIYLTSILEELITEKSQEVNTINQLITNQKGAGSHSKWCKKCNMTNIDNKKRNYPKCNEKLDTLATLQAESTNEFNKDITSQSGAPIIKTYEYAQDPRTSHLEHISITQQSNPDQVVIPEMH
ncbi:17851_t:CDS:1, partial [Racocetra fulgida]